MIENVVGGMSQQGLAIELRGSPIT
jgi:hypothetical protein